MLTKQRLQIFSYKTLLFALHDIVHFREKRVGSNKKTELSTIRCVQLHAEKLLDRGIRL